MINFIKEQLAIRKLKRGLREYTQPDRAFLKSAKLRFVTMAQQKSGVSVQARHSRSWKYATVAIMVILSMTSGVVVFADAKNVPVTHPLYNFKRVSEQIRMGLSSPTQQVKLHQVFAHRRLEEVVELEESSLDINEKDNQDNNVDKPISEKSKIRIDKLNKDFEDETETGLNKAQDPKIKEEVRQKFCQDILDTIKEKSDKKQNRMADRVKTRCNEDKNEINEEQKED